MFAVKNNGPLNDEVHNNTTLLLITLLLHFNVMILHIIIVVCARSAFAHLSARKTVFEARTLASSTS